MIGADGSVFQLPYMPFPDGGVVHRMTDYDLVRGYLHSDGLHWSFGAMSGRPEDWQAELARRAARCSRRSSPAATRLGGR